MQTGPKDFFSGLPHSDEIREGKYGELDYATRKAIARELCLRGLINTESTASAKMYLFNMMSKQDDNSDVDSRISDIEKELSKLRRDVDKFRKCCVEFGTGIDELRKEFDDYKLTVEKAMDEMVDMMTKRVQK